MRSNERVVFTRDSLAIAVPDGNEVTIHEGTDARITQALGTSFTVVTGYGQMFRIDARDADALGKTAEDLETADAGDGTLEDRIWNILGTCYDPEIPINIVELGLVYHCEILPDGHGKQRVEVKMTLTAPGCGMGDVLKREVEEKASALPEVSEVEVEIVFEPQWTQAMMSEAARLQLGFM